MNDETKPDDQRPAHEASEWTTAAPNPAEEEPKTSLAAEAASGAGHDEGAGHEEGAGRASESSEAESAPREETEEGGSEPVYEGPLKPVPTGQREWYIVKVQSNREDSIREAILRRARIAGFEDFFGEIVIPIEMVTEFKNGKKRVVKRKLYPGYIIVNMEVNEETFFLVRDTPGVGDFTGAGGKPVPMQAHEVERLIKKQDEKTEEQPKLKISFKSGDRVKINEGTFENFEGDVDAIDEANGRVTVMINIFGRSTPVELEYWQIETV